MSEVLTTYEREGLRQDKVRAPVAGSGDADPPYVEPEELAGPILRDSLPFQVQTLGVSEEGEVRCTEVRFLSEIYRGVEVFMHGWLCQPVRPKHEVEDADTRLPALLVIPGGRGVTEKELADMARGNLPSHGVGRRLDRHGQVVPDSRPGPLGQCNPF